MSFKKVLFEKAKEFMPDYIYNQKGPGEFSFSKNENNVSYDVIFQTSNSVQEFTVELWVRKIDPTAKHPELLPFKRERLGKIAYGYDYWWPYQKDQPQTLETVIKEALEKFKKYAPEFFINAKKQLSQ